MKRGAWCAAVVLVAVTGCSKQEAPPAPTTAAAPTPPPELLAAEALERQPVYTSLEAALREPEKVYRLDLSARADAPRLRALPAEVARLVKLQELKLTGQGLTELPEELARLRNLETLELARNELKDFPGFIVALPALRTLTLHSNPFQVSLALGQVKTLQRVDVGHGQGDLDALRESLPRVSWQVHAEGDVAAAAPEAAPEELEVAQPEPTEEEPAAAPKPGGKSRR